MDDLLSDEDVVIEGSALHSYLNNIGYTDFESVPSQYVNNYSRDNEILQEKFFNARNVYQKLFSLNLCVGQENIASIKYLQIISSAKTLLLDDHAIDIHNLKMKSETFPKTKIQKFLEISSVVTCLSCFTFARNQNFLSFVVSCIPVCFVSYLTFIRFHAYKDLKNMISMQNELFKLCKKGIQILFYDYNINRTARINISKFHILSVRRLKYLQPMVENLVKYLECSSLAYYQISQMIVELLPQNESIQHHKMEFDDLLSCCKLNGEINYQSLMKLYHTFIYLQSKMLHLLAHVYAWETWFKTYQRIPELKLHYIICNLTKLLADHKRKLHKIITSYNNCEREMIHYEFTGSISSKWKEVYSHLNLTSNKIQISFNYLTSVLQNIDSIMDETVMNNEKYDSLMVQMNEVHKNLDAAKCFAEFSTLLIAKNKFNNRKNDISVPFHTETETDKELSVIFDSEPKIEDEVFEEYIKEEYIKPLYEENDETMLKEYQFDKILAKNFISELKDVLVDKHKSMSERESIALKRMYKNFMDSIHSTSKLIETTASEKIPTPPPLPPINFHFLSIPEEKLNYSYNTSNFITNDNIEESIHQFQIPVPPEFKLAEEMFIGSGENSEDEFIVEDSNITQS